MQDRIEYEALVQKALRNVIRDILADVAKHNSLPGEHHFYITFDTQAPGVEISPRLKERFPQALTIVLQHRFWNMRLTEDAFSVSLSFGGITEKLTVPFAAMQVFYDPEAAFEVAFSGGAEQPQSPAPQAGKQQATEGVVAFPERHGGAAAPQADKQQAAAQPDETAPKAAEPRQPAAKAEEAEKDKNSASIVSLDAFRKK